MQRRNNTQANSLILSWLEKLVIFFLLQLIKLNFPLLLVLVNIKFPPDRVADQYHRYETKNLDQTLNHKLIEISLQVYALNTVPKVIVGHII